MRWEDLTPISGEANRKSCEECGLHVHNFAAMTAEEIDGVLRGSTGRVCARAYTRADGTVILQDCPVGLRAVRRKLVRSVARVAAVVMFAATGTWLWASGRKDAWQESRLRTLGPFATIAAKLDPAPPSPPVPMGRMIMGDVAYVPIAPPSAAGTPAGPPSGPAETPSPKNGGRP